GTLFQQTRARQVRGAWRALLATPTLRWRLLRFRPAPWRFFAFAQGAALSALACQVSPQSRSLLVKFAKQVAHDLKGVLGRGRVAMGGFQSFDEGALQHQA